MRAVGSSVSRATRARAHVDPGRDPGRGDELAILDPPLWEVGGAQASQQAVMGPVGGGLAPLEQPGRGQEHRSDADRADHLRRAGDLAQVVPDRLVAHRLDRRRAASGDDDHRGVGYLGEGLAGDDREGRAGDMGSTRSATTTGWYWAVEVPQQGEDLPGADHVQEGDAWIQHERDRLLLLGGHGRPLVCGTVLPGHRLEETDEDVGADHSVVPQAGRHPPPRHGGVDAAAVMDKIPQAVAEVAGAGGAQPDGQEPEGVPVGQQPRDDQADRGQGGAEDGGADPAVAAARRIAPGSCIGAEVRAVVTCVQLLLLGCCQLARCPAMPASAGAPARRPV